MDNLQKSGDASESSALTLGQIISELEPSIEEAYDLAVQMGREGMLQVEGEIRRGLIGMNGAGLLAVISLLSQSLNPWAVKIAAVLYCGGLLCGGLSWIGRSQASRMLFFSKYVFKAVFDEISTEPIGQVPLKTLGDLEETQKALHKVVDRISSKLKTPGRHIPIWSYAAIALFFLATVILVLDFEISPRCPPSPASEVPAAYC